MADDELAQISGISPNKVLVDGEEHQVKSASSKAVYKVKRTSDHYYCTCPAWRNQASTPTNVRTCKHLREMLGDEYEDARLEMKNPGGAPAKGKGKAKAAPKSKPKPKSKAKAKIEPEEEAEEVEEEAEPVMVAASTSAAKEDEPSEDVEMADPNDKEDELSSINGVKPLIVLAEGEENEVKSKTSKAVYKIKRTFDHFYCTCPAWRNQARVQVNARTCKHLKEALGEEYEDARLRMRNSGEGSGDVKAKAKGKETGKPASKAKPASKGKAKAIAADQPPSKAGAASSKRKRKQADADIKEEDGEGDDGGDEVEEETEGPKKRVKVDVEEVENDEDDDEEAGNQDTDNLDVINGIKPKVLMKDGDETEVSSQSSNSKYKVKRTWDHYYCTCPAWRNQGGVPVNARTCKHLKALLGEAYENARVKLKNPNAPAAGSPSKKKKDGKSAAPPMLLANKWDIETGPDPEGWWISEKLDGVRTYYDGKQMISRLGNPFTPPQWFLDKLPKDVILDGELFAGRGKFQSTVSIVKTVDSPHWKEISFQIFDVPSRGSDPFEERLEFLQKTFGEGGSHAQEQIEAVKHELARSREHVLEKLKEVEMVGGEGVMLRMPGSKYEGHRSGTLLKIKTFYDAEAIVTGYTDGKGKHKGLVGALKCKMESGKTFNVGTGLSDKLRKSPPKVGAIIVYRFQELTKDGVPRFPSYVGEAADKDKPKDAEIPEHRKQGVNLAEVDV